jgi:hypothetical protein
MTIKELNDVIAIFNKYGEYSNEEFAADHEQIWIGGPNEDELSEADREAVDKMGWFIDEDSWSHFV